MPPATRAPDPCAARNNVASSASDAGISATILPPNRTIARSQAKRDLRKFRGEQQHRRSRRGEFADKRVDLSLGADIDAARGIEAQQRVEAAGEPARDHNLLLIAAAQPADFRSRARIDLQPRDRGFDAGPLRPHPDRPPVRMSRNAGKATFSRIDRCCRSANKRLAGTRTTPARWRRRDGEVSVPCHARRSIPRRSGDAGDAVEQLLLALSFQRRDPQHLAGMELNETSLSSGLRRRLRTSNATCAALGAAERLGASKHAVATARAVSAPSMSETIRSSLPWARSVTPTVTPSRSTVARSHSAETSAMRWEMKITALPRSRQRLTIAKIRSDKIRRQRSRDLVEQEHGRLRGERAGEIDQAQSR